MEEQPITSFKWAENLPKTTWRSFKKEENIQRAGNKSRLHHLS